LRRGTSNLDAGILRAVLRAFLRERSPLAAMQVLYSSLNRFFQIPLPGFNPYVVGGPEAVRKVLVTEREKLIWRAPHDPVTGLLRRGVLVVDGEEHDRYRKTMEPLLHPGRLQAYVPVMLRQVDRVTAGWKEGQVVDMLVEARRIALLIIMETLFSVDCWEDLPRLWQPILKAIGYISPGTWILSPRLPRPGFRGHLQALDRYLYAIIAARRAAAPQDDLLGHLLAAGLDDERIRDQMLTMLIAGHDTSTALLAWVFHLLGQNTEIYTRLDADLEQALKGHPPEAAGGWQPPLLDAVIKEALRLYPPIHLGSRGVTETLDFGENVVPAGERLIYSIYLTHRDPAVWAEPERFDPGRFNRGAKQPPFSYVPFGGGPRACIGAAFGQAEARLVIARLLQTYRFEQTERKVQMHMGATLEPSPGVFLRVTRKPIA